MEKNGLSCSNLSKLVGCNRDTIRKYTDDKYNEYSMIIPIVMKIAKVFEMEQYYFMADYHVFIDSSDVGDFLRHLRKSRFHTQNEMAAQLDISLYNYKAYEQKKVNIPYKVYTKLLELFTDSKVPGR